MKGLFANSCLLGGQMVSAMTFDVKGRIVVANWRPLQDAVFMAIKIKGFLITDLEIARFWSKVKIRSKEECWLWQGGLHSKKKWFNYGTFWIRKFGHEMSHRLALSFHLGYWVGEKDVLHSCDNPPCCNPFHLKASDHFENMQDRVRRGRVKFQKGEDRPAAKLTEDNVRVIRKMADVSPNKNGTKTIWNKGALARKFGVDPSLIKRVIRRTAWRHVV